MQLKKPVDQHPFITGTNVQFAYDSTSLGWLKTCPELYHLQQIEGWDSKGENVHLRFGIEYHQTLQEWDIAKAKGLKHEEALDTAVNNLIHRLGDWDSDHKAKNRRNLFKAVIWYMDEYRYDPCKTYILDNGQPAVELSFKFELDHGPYGGQPYVLSGHLDRVVKYNNDLYVMDRKTTGSTPGQSYFNQFEPHNQMTLYTIASQIILHTPVKGVIIDAVQVTKEITRFARGFTFRTKAQMDEWLHDLNGWLALAKHYAEAGFWPHNDTACDKYGGCRFRDICGKDPAMRLTFLKAGFEKGERWNPLKPR